MKITSRRAVKVEAKPEAVYACLTDYDAYAEWMPAVASSRLLAQEGDLAVVEFELTAARGARQSVECIHDRNTRVIVRPIGGAALGQLRWTLARAADGGTDLELVVSSRIGWNLLKPGNWRARSAGRIVDGLCKHLGAAGGVAFGADPGSTVVELVETPAGMVLWLNGKRYRLVSEAED